MILGFAGVILLGALVLMLPIATASHTWTPFHEALFTSTSAVCVTGLVVQDTGSYWSGFGQTVILLLIQIGGLGVITAAVTFLMLSGRNISLKERSAMQDAISAPVVGGIVRLTRFILKGTFFVELVGALALLPAFCRDYGLRGVWMAIFHSVSAFCNAGFDILGRADTLYPSLTAYISDPLVNIVIMLLIVVGGIGFLTWDDVCTHRLHLRRYRMQSKVILSATAILIALPALLFFLTDFAELPAGQRVLASLFQAVTPRTAGYNTADLTKMSDTSQAVTILLMLTGGAPGSTAGGMKVTTLAVLAANAIAKERNFVQSQDIGKANKAEIKEAMDDVLKKMQGFDLTKFKEELGRRGFKVREARASTGKLNGYYVTARSGTEYKASEIGKGYTLAHIERTQSKLKYNSMNISHGNKLTPGSGSFHR